MTEQRDPATRVGRAVHDEITTLVLAPGLWPPTGTEPVRARGTGLIARSRAR